MERAAAAGMATETATAAEKTDKFSKRAGFAGAFFIAAPRGAKGSRGGGLSWLASKSRSRRSASPRPSNFMN
jgi:hypothetical protein